MAIKLNFKIDEDYLVTHLLASTGGSRFSSNKYKKDIVALQNYAWKRNRACYNILIGRIFAGDINRKTLGALPGFLANLKKSKEYKKIRAQGESYLRFCSDQWKKNYVETSEKIRLITGFNLNETFVVYITHPGLRNGKYVGNHAIQWGHNEDWPNYVTVYLWHEILHSYLGKSDIEHAVIELIADNELRVGLNGGKYPPLVGHADLADLKKKLLPKWKIYLRSSDGNIKKFIKSVTK